MKRYLLILTFLMIFQDGFSEDLQWFQGSVVLENKDVVKGEIAYQPEFDVVLLRTADQLTVYNAHRINSFFYFDGKANVNRKFISIPFNTVAFTSFSIYEIVAYGETKVLRRLASDLSDASNDIDGYRYFIYRDNVLTPMRQFGRKIYPVLSRQNALLDVTIKNLGLNIYKDADVVRIVLLSNKLAKEQSLHASL